MTRDEYRDWCGRIVATTTLADLTRVRAQVAVLPISNERFTLLLACSAHRSRGLSLAGYRAA